MTEKARGTARRWCRFFFGIYLIALVYFLLFSEEWGRSVLTGTYRYNFVPFREIGRYLKYHEQIGTGLVLLNLAGNVIGFIPFGGLAPAFSNRRMSFFRVLLFSLELSLFVEIAQLVLQVGSCDVDDILLNIFGSCIGYCLYRLVIRCLRSQNSQGEGEHSAQKTGS
ncbi:MAG: VanZ family protein [Lachnospiraceae bacterium]|nr:VanZ family protein [Lachnospiraceae bacterium]MCD8250309.1 VanZ family protein [Lachnospiraceae bacterium]